MNAEESLSSQFQLLPLVGDTLDAVLSGDDQGAARAAKALADRIAECHKLLSNIPGGELGPEEQRQVYEREVERARRKGELLAAYRDLAVLQEHKRGEQGGHEDMQVE